MPKRSASAAKRQYGFRLDAALMEELEHVAVDERKWMGELIEEAVRMLLADRGKRKGKAGKG